jgi:mannan endo-1,4-beta-mannosidase
MLSPHIVLARIAAHALILGVNPRCSSILVGVFVVWGVLTETSSVQALDVANPHASAAARRVLDFFHQLTARRDGRRIISGQFSDFGSGASLKIMEQIHDKTDRWPAIIGVDYADFPRGALTTDAPNQAALAYWKQGGLVTISAHLYNPANPKGGGFRDKGVHLEDLLTPGNETNRRWMQELATLADGLEALKTNGVVVLWRPFHEMNGGWFWWGGHEPAKFIQLWRQMFTYFSDERHLDNLLWVYAPNHGDHTAAYYAGDHFVDLVGLDAYTDSVDPGHIRGYEEVALLPKPFGFSEFGPHGPQNPPGDYDYRQFLAGMTNHFPKVRYFKAWNGRWGLGENRYTREFLNDPSILNREDLPRNLTAAE